MKFCKNHHRLAVMALCVLFALSALLLPGCTKSSAYSPQDRIAATLSGLGVADARPDETGSAKLSDEGALLYTSNETQMGYFFDPKTGALLDVFDFNTLGGTYRETAAASPAPAPVVFAADNRDAFLLEYAKVCIGPDLIGDLSLRVGQDLGELHSYTVTESYDGIPTGTAVSFSTGADGRIGMVNVTIGSVFEKAKDGTWVLDTDKLIGEEAAIQIARDSLKALDLEIRSVSEDATCKLDAVEDLLIYTIHIGFTDAKGREREYRCGINAYTGELWREVVTR